MLTSPSCVWASRSLPSVHIPEWCGREAKCARCLGNGRGPLVFAEKKDLNSLCFCFPRQNFIPCTQVMVLLGCVTLTPGSQPARTPAPMVHQSQPLPSFLQPTPDPLPNLLLSSLFTFTGKSQCFFWGPYGPCRSQEKSVLGSLRCCVTSGK